MIRTKYYLTFTLLCSTFLVFSENAKSQYIYTPVFPDQCGYQEARCTRDSNGNIVDKKTGDIYDRKGNLLQRGNGNRTSQKRCKYVTDDNCGLWNMNCVNDYYWKCS
jgi:hypothetical protein